MIKYANRPWFKQWVKENPWFDSNRSSYDFERTHHMLAIGARLVRLKSPLRDAAFMDKCMQIMQAEESMTEAA